MKKLAIQLILISFQVLFLANVSFALLEAPINRYMLRDSIAVADAKFEAGEYLEARGTYETAAKMAERLNHNSYLTEAYSMIART